MNSGGAGGGGVRSARVSDTITGMGNVAVWGMGCTIAGCGLRFAREDDHQTSAGVLLVYFTTYFSRLVLLSRTATLTCAPHATVRTVRTVSGVPVVVYWPFGKNSKNSGKP
jgi:hypothetical protein